MAVCLLFAFKNPAHEQEVGAYLRRRLPGVFISLSSEVSPRLGEYERTSTTVLNAALSPLLADHLEELQAFFAGEGMKGRVWLMQNNGGLTDSRAASSFGIKGLFSGPAGGAALFRPPRARRSTAWSLTVTPSTRKPQLPYGRRCAGSGKEAHRPLLAEMLLGFLSLGFFTGNFIDCVFLYRMVL
ncbi:hydantoinase/oxoprolinase family protein [Moorella naiadis]|uniref:hydantoinase/oxoprolinase family protein n=1 Tax=Moorella naiadis (nom. illeg.) TaxID=3093670 RepID=UPI003D9C917D